MAKADLTRYVYTGPVCAVSIPTSPDKPAGPRLSVVLSPGKEVELPAAAPYVIDLLERGHLSPAPQPAPEPAAPAPAAPKSTRKEN